jgi:transcriptional regulator with XRE-family HTH domain
MTRTASHTAGALLRDWRQRRHLTQLELAGRAGVSSRHLSFIETGRARPTSEMILRLCEHLDIPLRERNAVLLAAGHAPAYPRHGLSDPPLAAVSDAINRVLALHEPFPAVVIDRHWDLVAANAPVDALIAGVAPHLLDPPVNVLRLTLHPKGMAPRVRNLGQWRAHLLERLSRDISATGDPELMRLRDELIGYPGAGDAGTRDVDSLLMPLRLAMAEGELSLVSTTTVFGTPREVTVAELAIESFYPADKDTSDTLQRLARRRAAATP